MACFVSVLGGANKKYLDEALQLAHSVKRFNAKKLNHVLCVDSLVPPLSRACLEHFGYTLVDIELVPPPKSWVSHGAKSRFLYAFSKLRIFDVLPRLGYQAAIYLDLDTRLFADITHLFDDIPSDVDVAAAPDNSCVHDFNSGVFFFRTSALNMSHMLQWYEHVDCWDRGDQSFLNQYIRAMVVAGTMRFAWLPVRYNSQILDEQCKVLHKYGFAPGIEFGVWSLTKPTGTLRGVRATSENKIPANRMVYWRRIMIKDRLAPMLRKLEADGIVVPDVPGGFDDRTLAPGQDPKDEWPTVRMMNGPRCQRGVPMRKGAQRHFATCIGRMADLPRVEMSIASLLALMDDYCDIHVFSKPGLVRTAATRLCEQSGRVAVLSWPEWIDEEHIPLGSLLLTGCETVHFFMPGIVFRHIPDEATFPEGIYTRCIPKMHMPDAVSNHYMALRPRCSTEYVQGLVATGSLHDAITSHDPGWKGRLLPPSVCQHAMLHLFLPEYLRFLEEDKERPPNQTFCRTHLRWRFGITNFDPIGMSLMEEFRLFLWTLYDTFNFRNQWRQHLHEYSCLYEFARMPYELQAHCEKTGKPPDSRDMMRPTSILLLAFFELLLFNVIHNVKSLLGALKLRKRWY